MNNSKNREGLRAIFASLMSIAIGLLSGCLIIFIIGLANGMSATEVINGIGLVALGMFCTGTTESGALIFGFNAAKIGNMLFTAMPLIMTGLSVAVANKTGLFNIGASGQYLAGTCATIFVALSLPAAVLPSWLIWLLALLAGFLAGALWGAIPGLLKAMLNINEVISCIMTNWIAANLVTWLFDISSYKNMVEGTKTQFIYKTTFNNVATSKLGLDRIFAGSQVNAGFLVTIVFAVIMYVIFRRTTFGYELQACGSNRYAARYAGIRDKQKIVISMALAGALAGVGAALYWLSGNTEFAWSTYQTLPAEGFNGIPVALLASNNSVGVIFSGMFMSMLSVNGQQLKNMTSFNEYITDVITAVIVYMSAFSLIIKMWLGKKNKHKDDLRGSEPAKPAQAKAAKDAKGGH